MRYQPGHIVTPETRAKLRAAATGRKMSAEAVAAMRAAITGRALSAEHRAKYVGNRFVLDAPVKGECVYCGQPATGHDHVLPRKAPYGGSDHADNVVPCCATCNRSKRSRDPWAWLAAGLYGTRFR